MNKDFKQRLDEYLLFNMNNWLSYYTEDNSSPKDNKEDGDLESILASPKTTFQEKLFEIIDHSGLKDTDVYKRAHIDRKLFSRIRCKSDYKPKKDTALALVIALRLTIEETDELLKLAELALSPCIRADQIIRFCIINGVDNVDEVNEILDKYGEKSIGM